MKEKCIPAKRKRNGKKTVLSKNGGDPSTLYLRHPLKAPLVLECKKVFKDLGFAINIHVGPTQGWRTIAKLAVRNGGEKSNLDVWEPIKIGLFKPGSHDVIDCTNSPAHHVSINSAAKLIRAACNRARTTAFDELTGKGFLRYLLFGVERRSSKVQLTIVWNSQSVSDGTEAGNALRRLLEELKFPCGPSIFTDTPQETCISIFHSAWVHFHMPSVHVNAITGREEGSWRRIFGRDAIHEHIEVGAQFPQSDESTCNNQINKLPVLRFPPNVFRQANIDSFANIIREIRGWIEPQSACVELYAGVGTIGLNCLDLFSSLRCSDENPFNKICFEASVAELPGTIGCKATYQSTPASTVATSGGLVDCDLIIVDPPRKGLDREVLDALCIPLPANRRKKRLIYVSCGFNAFRRDADALLGRGDRQRQWTLQHAAGYVLFPGANHIETLAIFDKTS